MADGRHIGFGKLARKLINAEVYAIGLLPVYIRFIRKKHR